MQWYIWQSSVGTERYSNHDVGIVTLWSALRLNPESLALCVAKVNNSCKRRISSAPVVVALGVLLESFITGRKVLKFDQSEHCFYRNGFFRYIEIRIFSTREFKSKLLLPSYISPRDTLAYFIFRVVSLGQIRRKESPCRFHSGITPLDFVYTEDTPLLVSNVG